MNRYGTSMTLALTLGALMAALGGCPADDPLPDDTTTSSSGSGGAGGGGANCGNGVLDMGETCDDGNNASGDGCTSCEVDACYTCTGDAGALSVCTAQAAGEACDAGVCDGSGTCVECLEDMQCAGGYCFEKACAKCDDGAKNGDETDVDCGGPHCPTCDQGKMCTANEDCTTTFCTDGFCCGEACDGACLACNLAGSEGDCKPIDKYAEDPNYGMGEACLYAEGEECSGAGLCGKGAGQPCMGNAECVSFKCADPDMDMMKTCVRADGEPCTQNGDCQSNNCMANVCAP